jgi:hypothetical protein
VIAALHNVQRIDPKKSGAFLGEADLYEVQGNLALNHYRDPSPYVDKELALASEARAHQADATEVDLHVCVANWERACYQGGHGSDPHAAFVAALTACRSAVAAKPGADAYDAR